MLREIIFPEYFDSPSPFNSVDWHAGLATQGQLLIVHSNAAVHNYTGTAQLFDKGEKSGKNVPNIIRLITTILPKLKPQFSLNINDRTTA